MVAQVGLWVLDTKTRTEGSLSRVSIYRDQGGEQQISVKRSIS
jgi:hypothetical protein